MSPLEKLESLAPDEERAFLAFFAGARGRLSVFRRGDTGEEISPTFGKAECQWVPFREFWQKKLPDLGFVTFEETEPRPALGMVDGSTFTDVAILVTDEGRRARDDYWAEWKRRVDELVTKQRQTDAER